MENNERVFLAFLMLMLLWSPFAALAALVGVMVLRLIFYFGDVDERYQKIFCVFLFGGALICVILYMQESMYLTGFYIGKLCFLDGWALREYTGAVFRDRRLILAIAATALCFIPLLYAAAFCMRSIVTPRQALRDMRKKVERAKVNPKVIKAVAGMESDSENGVLLGATKRKKPFFLSPVELNRHVMLVGTTGSGKTTTIYRFIEYCVNSLQAGIFIDGKGDEGFIRAAEAIAARRGRKIKAFVMSPEETGEGYNPFCVGSPSEMTDKVISMFDWTEPHYKLSAQRFLQLLFRAFKVLGITPDLPTVTQYCDKTRLKVALQTAKGQPKQAKAAPKEYFSLDDLDALDGSRGQDEAHELDTPSAPMGAHEAEAVEITEALEGIDERAIQGIASRLGVIAEGDLRDLLRSGGGREVIKIHEVLDNRDIAVFSLDSLRYPEQAREFGRLIINDLKANIAEHMKRRGGQHVTLIFDEFNVFASSAVVDLVNKSRSAGFEALLSFQSLADIDAAADNGQALAEQIIQNCNTLIIQRQNSADDRFSKAGGTRDAVELTYQAGTAGGTGLGSARLVQEFRIDPNVLKNLQTGEAIVKRNIKNAENVERIFIKNTEM